MEQLASRLLVAALFTSFTIPAWITPPELSLSHRELKILFEFLMGVSSILFSLAILTSLDLIKLLSRPYTKLDTAVAFWCHGGFNYHSMGGTLIYAGVAVTFLGAIREERSDELQKLLSVHSNSSSLRFELLAHRYTHCSLPRRSIRQTPCYWSVLRGVNYGVGSVYEKSE